MTLQEAIAVRDAHSDELMALPGVVGTGIGMDGDRPCIHVYLLDETARGDIPAELDGVPLVPEVTGMFQAL